MPIFFSYGKQSTHKTQEGGMRIYAVNCDRGRGERLIKAAEPLGLDIVLVPSPLWTDEEVQRRGKTCFERNTSYPTGCAATMGHMRALAEFAKSGEPLGIIIEDDVRFHKHFNRLVDALTPHMMEGNTDVLSLGYVNFPQGEWSCVGGEYIIRNVGTSNPWGAQCYMVTHRYAKYLSDLFSVDDVAIPFKNHFVTDWVLFDRYELGCRRDVMLYPIAIESPDEQTIAGSTNKADLFACGMKHEDFYL